MKRSPLEVRHQAPRTVIQILALVLCLLALSLVGGCSCWKDPLGRNKKNANSNKTKSVEEMAKEREKKIKEAKEKEEELDFESIKLAVLPADDDSGANKAVLNQVKPGHWFNAVHTMKANKFDFPQGELEAQCISTRGRAIRLPNTEYHLNSTRPANLPKGQEKNFDLLLHASKPKSGAINFVSRLQAKGGGRELSLFHAAASTMKKFQNHFVVLSDRPDNYQFVKTLRTVRPIRTESDMFSVDFDYFVKLPKGKRRIDVPSHALAWTTTAYVLWDDFDPEIMNLDQQQAMIDWLHWGGQLIINGPQTLDKLRSSQFGKLLPAKAAKVGKISREQVEELNSAWSFTEESDASQLVLPEKEDDWPLALELELTDGARFIPSTSNLVAEKLVGRGRVVATAFNTPHSFFQKWDSFDTFFNSCLLGRPSRRFSARNGSVTERWSDVSQTLGRDDPRLTSTVRYFSRDALKMTNRMRSNSTNQTATRMLSNFRVVQVGRGRSRMRPLNLRQNLQLPGMPQVTANRPGSAIQIRGQEVVEAGSTPSYSIDFQNSGNSMLVNGRIRVEWDDDLTPLQATESHEWDEDGNSLTWALQPAQPGMGNSLQIKFRASPNPGSSSPEIRAEFLSDQADSDEVFTVGIGSADAKHQLSRVASQAFGVNGFGTSDLFGVAGWDDQSDISKASRRALEYAAGISVPAKSFVAKVIGLYLLILVPLNWIIFRLMGRVEWAWAAVPLIATGGAIGVVKAAQLDIGFVRSRTEVAVVEMQPNFDRAHVSRYIGFYTSLSSDYEIRGEESSTLIQPLGLSRRVDEREPTNAATVHQDDGIRMSGFDVTSNSTGLVHTEQMLDMGGSISLVAGENGDVITNDSSHDLKAAAVVRRNVESQIEVAWIGDLGTKQRFTELNFVPLQTAHLAFEQWEESAATSTTSLEGDLNIRQLMEVASDPKRLGPNESVLVGWSDKLLDGIQAKPAATQINALTLFVVQLQHADRPEPKRDADCYAVLERRERDNEDDDEIY